MGDYSYELIPTTGPSDRLTITKYFKLKLMDCNEFIIGSWIISRKGRHIRSRTTKVESFETFIMDPNRAIYLLTSGHNLILSVDDDHKILFDYVNKVPRIIACVDKDIANYNQNKKDA